MFATSEKKSLFRQAMTPFMAFALLSCAPASDAQEARAPAIEIGEDGSLQLPPLYLPMTKLMSPEGQVYLNEHLHNLRNPELTKDVNGVPPLLQPFIDRQRELFPVVKKDTAIGGVHVFDYAPEEGVPEENKNRVLIQLHGGGFQACFPACAELESMPISSLGKIRVVSVDYRQGPDHEFPAASEDVAKVYAELLKSYPADNIGIYGCSAGGMLTGMSIAWFQAHDLPRPGAAGIFCAGASLDKEGFGGDAGALGLAIGDGIYVPAQKPGTERVVRNSYLANVDPKDPLAAPVESDEVLSQFPPTLFITGTRSYDLSTSVYTHSRMVALGVEADLHVWEGMFHGFYVNPDVPESREVYDVTVRFFDEHLGR